MFIFTYRQNEHTSSHEEETRCTLDPTYLHINTHVHTRSASCGDDVSFTGDELNTEHFTLNLQGRKHNTTVKLWRESCLITFHGSWTVSTMMQEKQTRSIFFWRFTTEIYEQQRTSGILFISFTLEWCHKIQIVTINVVFKMKYWNCFNDVNIPASLQCLLSFSLRQKTCWFHQDAIKLKASLLQFDASEVNLRINFIWRHRTLHNNF